MPLQDCADIRCAAVRDLHRVSVKDLVQVASSGKMAIDYAEESARDVCRDVTAEWRRGPCDVSLPRLVQFSLITPLLALSLAQEHH